MLYEPDPPPLEDTEDLRPLEYPVGAGEREMPGGSFRPFGTCGAFWRLIEIPQAWSLSSVGLRGGGGGDSSSLRSTHSIFLTPPGPFSEDCVEDVGGAAPLGGAPGLTPTGAPGLAAPGAPGPPGLGPPGLTGPPGLIPLGGIPLGPPGLIPLAPGAPGLIGILGLIPGLICPLILTPPLPLTGLTGRAPGLVGVPGVPMRIGSPGRTGEEGG